MWTNGDDVEVLLIKGELQANTPRVDQRLSGVISNGGDVSPALDLVSDLVLDPIFDPLLLPIWVIRSPVEETVFETVFNPEILPVLSSDLSPVWDPVLLSLDLSPVLLLDLLPVPLESDIERLSAVLSNAGDVSPVCNPGFLDPQQPMP